MQKKKSHLVISIKLFTQYFWLFSFIGKCENPKADFSAQLPETASAIRCLKRKFNNYYDQSVSLLLPSHSRHLFLLILGLCHPFRLTFGAFCGMCFYDIWDKPPPAHTFRNAAQLLPFSFPSHAEHSILTIQQKRKKNPAPPCPVFMPPQLLYGIIKVGKDLQDHRV